MKTPQFLLRTLQFARTLGKGRPPVRTGRAPFSASGSPVIMTCSRGWLPVVDSLVAGGADDERLAPHSRHQGWPMRAAPVPACRGRRACGPGGLPPWPRCSHHSHLAAQEPGDQLLAAGGGRGGQAVVDDRLALPFERDAAEPCDQWLPARPLGAGLEAGPGPVPGDDDGLVLAGHLRHRRAVLGGQGLQHGGLGVPVAAGAAGRRSRRAGSTGRAPGIRLRRC